MERHKATAAQKMELLEDEIVGLNIRIAMLRDALEALSQKIEMMLAEIDAAIRKDDE